MSEYNQRQYRLMLDRLVAFEEGDVSLGALVIDLEGLLGVLERIDASWREAFLHLWGKLEDERAFALFKNIKVVDQETTERIVPVISKLKLMVLERIDDPADRYRSNGS